MNFSLTDYKARTDNIRNVSGGDINGLYLSWLERWLFTLISRLWRAFYRPRLIENDGSTQTLLAVPARLRAEHVANCRMYADRDYMLEDLTKGKVWAELGTFEGAFAKEILKVCAPSELHLLDLDFSRVRAAGHIVESDVVKFHQGDSATRLREFPDGYFDYIYIDAGHDLCDVARDADVARSKVKRGGMLVFNDYVIYSHIDQLPFGIVPVVNSLCVEDGWTMVAFALDSRMYCDVALRRNV